MLRFLSPSLLLLSLLVAVPSPGPAQTPTGNLRLAVFALRDARIVTEPGKTLEKASLVIRDGLIEAIGPDIKIPTDALVIDAAGMTVYPGFLDALSHRGYDATLRRSESGPPGAE